MTAPTTTGGPYRTRQQATVTACRAMLRDACEAAGVRLGRYDAAVLDDLAHGDPAACAALASIITRATGVHPVPGPVCTDPPPYAAPVHTDPNPHEASAGGGTTDGRAVLAVMRRMLDGNGGRSLPTADVLAALDDDREPGTVPLDAWQLAALLAPYGLAPVKVNPGGRRLQGYHAAHIKAACERLDDSPAGAA